MGVPFAAPTLILRVPCTQDRSFRAVRTLHRAANVVSEQHREFTPHPLPWLRCGSDESFIHPLTKEKNGNLCVPRTAFDSDRTFFVFVSHRWLRPAHGHPDDQAHSKCVHPTFRTRCSQCCPLRVVPCAGCAPRLRPILCAEGGGHNVLEPNLPTCCVRILSTLDSTTLNASLRPSVADTTCC